MLSWQHALFLHNLADRIVREAGDECPPVRALFAAVYERVGPVAAPKATIPWPATVWQVKQGLCDRQAWLLSELAYQHGYETMIVYLQDPETLVSPHTICEIRRGEQVWVADPYSGILLPDVSVADLATDPELAASTWPDREDWQQAIRKPACWLPAFPQDYCWRNRVLRRHLAPILGQRCPRFGRSPEERLKEFLARTGTRQDDIPYRYWFYPFRLLRSHMLSTRQDQREREPAPPSDRPAP